MSISQRLVSLALRATKRKAAASDDPAAHRAHVAKAKRAAPSARVRRLADIRTETVAGCEVTVLTPRRGFTGTRLVYYHGGTFFNPLIWPHWTIIGEMIARAGAEVWVPHYPLLFEHTVDDVLPVIDALDERVASSLADVDRYAVAGDSAGGNLALVHALRAREAGRRQADALVLLAPWVDVRLPSTASLEIEPTDPMLTVREPRALGAYWAGERRTDDPMVSPGLMKNPGALPPMLVLQGGRDVLAPDVLEFVEAVRADGGEIELDLVPDGFHVHVGTRLTPEGRAGMRRMAAAVRGDADA